MAKLRQNRYKQDCFRLFGVTAVWLVFILFAGNAGFPQNHMGGEDVLSHFNRIYQQEKVHEFNIGPEDQVVGDRGTSVHQIVLIYDDACPACEEATEKLIVAVHAHDQAVYLVLKHRKHIPEPMLDVLNISRFPAVFIDGKYAEGWNFPGFLQPFVEDCGC